MGQSLQKSLKWKCEVGRCVKEYEDEEEEEEVEEEEENEEYDVFRIILNSAMRIVNVSLA